MRGAIKRMDYAGHAAKRPFTRRRADVSFHARFQINGSDSPAFETGTEAGAIPGRWEHAIRLGPDRARVQRRVVRPPTKSWTACVTQHPQTMNCGRTDRRPSTDVADTSEQHEHTPRSQAQTDAAMNPVVLRAPPSDPARHRIRRRARARMAGAPYCGRGPESRD